MCELQSSLSGLEPNWFRFCYGLGIKQIIVRRGIFLIVRIKVYSAQELLVHQETKMEILKGASIYHPDTCAKYIGISAPVITYNITKTLYLQSEGWGYKHRCKSIFQVGVQFGGISPQPYCKKQWCVHCSFNSSSDVNGSMARNFNANDEDYVKSTVIEAVQVISESDGFMIKMCDGRSLRCIHNNPQGEKISDNSPHPAIVLKMEDGSGLLLPIVVLQMPSLLLMAAIRNIQITNYLSSSQSDD